MDNGIFWDCFSKLFESSFATSTFISTVLKTRHIDFFFPSLQFPLLYCTDVSIQTWKLLPCDASSKELPELQWSVQITLSHPLVLSDMLGFYFLVTSIPNGKNHFTGEMKRLSLNLAHPLKRCCIAPGNDERKMTTFVFPSVHSKPRSHNATDDVNFLWKNEKLIYGTQVVHQPVQQRGHFSLGMQASPQVTAGQMK